MRRALLVFAAALAVVPAFALAASPAKNSAFRFCASKDLCAVKFETDRRGRYVQDLRLYPKCAPVPTRWPRLRVREGAFSREGTIRDVTGQKLKYSISGRFTTPRKAVLAVDIDRRDCKDRRRRFTARRYGRAQPGV